MGFTTATFQGGEGILGFTKACQAEFPETRMCTSVEVMQTVGVPALPSQAQTSAGIYWTHLEWKDKQTTV